ncbi:MAG: hypothetical protein QXE80_03400 [Pyrobaculum sp.]
MHVAQRALTIAQQAGANTTELNRFARRYFIISEGRELAPEWLPKPEMVALLTNEKYNEAFLTNNKVTHSMFRNLAFNKEIRIVLDVLFLHGYTDEQAAEALRLSGYHGINEEVIGMYRYFFFDPSLVDGPEEFEKILEYMPRTLAPHEHRAAYYNPWVGQLFSLNVLVPVDFDKITEAALSVAYARLMKDFHERRNEIPFSELIKVATKGIEMKARMNIDKENEQLKTIMERIAVNFIPIRNKTLDELMKYTSSGEGE